MIALMMITSSLSVPPEPGVLTPAMEWIEGTMLGTLATIIAMLSIAGCGALMLQGRLAARRALTVIAGCFILFGAASIARGLRTSADQVAAAEPGPIDLQSPSPAPHARVAPQPPHPPFGDDPYAGVAVQR